MVPTAVIIIKFPCLEIVEMIEKTQEVRMIAREQFE